MNKLLAGLLIIVAGSICSSPQAVGQALDDNALLEQLQSGGLVLLFRHGETGPDSDRPDAISGRYALEGSAEDLRSAYFDCERQRNLSDEGREDLRKVANAIRQLRLVIEHVYASPMCRTRESAWLLVGRVSPAGAMIGPDSEARRDLVSRIPADGSIRVLVSHGYVVSSIVPNPVNPDKRGQIVRGHAHVLEPLGHGEFRILAQLGPDDWMRLAELAEQKSH